MAADNPLTIDDMKKIIKTMLFGGLLTFLFGCKQTPVTKDALIGVWMGETQNATPIKDLGFNSIKLTFTADSVEVFNDMNAWGGHVTTKSTGPWKLDKNILLTKFGDQKEFHECSITIDGDKIIFQPDLFFNPETVRSSEYKKQK